ncbi:HEAT repeat-containing protein 1 [Ornithorhynchus anatinus]|uniref:HEAT repeat-containing protein 1 n=1 Tax=Ornithorhynchus anatinus TaxID=9258 RepID=F7EA76_ORNAN|nr:HEAT repeat-containing protein 1 [Ornithorhynchus anatinus]XP_039770759.1 HEAT repeat-containing protein 1 [Ornithorhynchus anatinus]
MTSLAHQLKRLAVPQTDSTLFSRHEVASLLFESKEAATVDRDTFFAIGCNGIEELLGIDSSFEQFEATLFSQVAKNLERSVQTQAVNNQLDENIGLFLIHLSPYFMLKPAQKCLEWLIHRFHIHLYNQDSLIGCVLPYHETKIFVRVIQLLKISNPTHRWNWMEPVKNSGIPLAKGTLITHCYRDLGFMDFVCSLVAKSVKVLAEDPQHTAQLRVLLAFYASTVVSALASADSVSDSTVAKLLPFIQKGLKSSTADYRAATYMIVCQLSVKVPLEATVVHSLALQISKTLAKIPSLVKDGLCCLVVLLQRQKTDGLGKKPFNYLCSVPDLVPTLREMATAFDISPLLRYVLPILIGTTYRHAAGEDSKEVDGQSDPEYLEAILKEIPLENNLDRLVASALLEEFISYGSEKMGAKKVATFDRRLLPLVRLFESKYSGALDWVLEKHLKEMSDDASKRNCFHRFISLSTGGGKYQIVADSATSLLLSLNHPLATVRLLAVKHLRSIAKTSKESIDDSFVREAILARLGDDNLKVVLSALNAFKEFKEQFSPEATVSSLLGVFQRAEQAEVGEWYEILELAGSILVKEGILSRDAPAPNPVVVRLLPFMILTSSDPSSPERRLAFQLAGSGICSLHPLLEGWQEALEHVLKTSRPTESVGAANRKMVQLLAGNISSGDRSWMLQLVEDLISVAEQEVYAVKQKMTSTVVTWVLVGCCCSSRKETHFPFARRVLGLLEKKMKQLEHIVSALEIAPEWYSELTSDSQVPVGMWSGYLDGLREGQVVAAEDSAMVLFMLRSFVLALKPPRSFPRGEPWWDPERLSQDGRDYLRILVGLFEVLLGGGGAVHFRLLMRLFLKEHLEDSAELFTFLSTLWTYRCSLSDPLHCSVSAVLQVRALYAGGAVLASQTAQRKKQLASASSPVVVSLLINLGSPIKEVRRAAIHCLEYLDGEKGSPFHAVVRHVVQKAEEIVSDATYIVQDLESLFTEQQAENQQKSPQKLSGPLNHLLSCVHAPGCPSYIVKSLLKILQGVNSEAVLCQLLPTLDRLLEKARTEPAAVPADEAAVLQLALAKFNEHSAPLLRKDPRSLELFVKAVQTPQQPRKGTPAPQLTALGQMTKPFFAAVSDEKIQQKLLGVLFDLLLNCKSPVCAQTVGNVFKGISVNAKQISLELELPDKSRAPGTVQQARRQKMQQKKSPDPEAVQEVGSVSWQRVTLILELLQHKKKLQSPQALVPALFNLLSRFLELLPVEQRNLEYTKQLILSCLLSICQKLSPDGARIPKDVLDEEKFNVELIVQCVRLSEMPQTHHHALLLLGTAATIFPDKVLHNIMPIFTFMGANVMRLDDSYSFQVINKTVEMVIPALIQADKRGSGAIRGNLEEMVVKIMNVFVDALPHVPEHRRLPILVQLVNTLGADRFLWALLALLFEQYVTKTVLVAATREKDTVLEADTEFWISICCKFRAGQQIQSLLNILQYLTKLPENKEEEEPKKTRFHKAKSQAPAVQIFNVETHTSKQLRHFKFLSLSFMTQLLASQDFIAKVAESGYTRRVKRLERRFLEEVLCYINTVVRSVENNQDKLTAKFWRALLSKAYDLLDKANALLPLKTFLPMIKGLMVNKLPSVRRKAMELLNNQLHLRPRWSKDQVELLLKLIPHLLAIAARKTGAEEEEEQAINRQTALYSLKLLCRSLGPENTKSFVPVLDAVIRLIAQEGKEERNVLGSALLCVAEVTCTLGALAIPQLPSLMPTLLKTLERSEEPVSSEVYLLSAVTALQKVVEALPQFLSPYLRGILFQVVRVKKITEGLSPASQAHQRVLALEAALATTLSSRVFLAAVTECYEELEQKRKSGLGPLMGILQEHIAVMEKIQLYSHQSQLTSFFLKALDFRAKHPEDDLEEVGKTEGDVIGCLVAMVIKLSEVNFRPLFFKLFDWSKTTHASKDRLLTFSRLADRLADKLKGLFGLFAGHLVKPLADALHQVHLSKTEEPFFDARNPEKSCLLLRYVLGCLHKIFLYDTQRFVSKERAEALMMPLVDQLENLMGGEEAFQERVATRVIPCLAQFAVAMADDSLWKPLNYQILLKMRHAAPKVRFAALLAVLELAEKLRENYVVLLPESIPFLAELMEDECEEVEHQCQKTIQRLEIILGEPLQSYF